MNLKNDTLFKNTYKSMVDRTQENGYAKTSVTGAYPGMFGRDSSIQIMAHVQAGDFVRAKKLLNYILDYHQKYNYKYVIHVMDDDKKPISDKLQTDSTYFFLYAWYMYTAKAPESAEKTEFINTYLEQITDFADYFIDNGYVKENNMIYNPSLEHSREGRYWQSFDLLTNVIASQTLHEVSLFFKGRNAGLSEKYENIAERIVKGVHENLVSEIDGKKYYAELIDCEHNNAFCRGFSWVSLAPMAVDWYGADEVLLENTYELYKKYGAITYYNKYCMLDACSTYNGQPLTPERSGQHVIGKGLVWEMLYCFKKGQTERLNTLTDFIAENSVDMYRETWGYNGGGSDTANQEHACWMLYGMEKIYKLKY